MAWEEIKQRVNPKLRMPCKVALARKDENSRTVFRLSLSGALITSLDWPEKGELALAVGSGEHAGKLRVMLAPAGNGVAKLHKMKRVTICDFGHVEPLGMTPRELVAAEYAVKDGALFVTLPDPWPERGESIRPRRAAPKTERNEPAGSPESEPSRIRWERQAPAPVVKPAAPAKNNGGDVPMLVSYDDVSVRFSPPSFRAAASTPWVDCLTMEARCLAPLVRCLNQILPIESIAKAAYAPRKNTPGAAESIRGVLSGLVSSLPKSGLKLTYTKGIGYTLARQ